MLQKRNYNFIGLIALALLAMAFIACDNDKETKDPTLTGITANYTQGTTAVYTYTPINDLKTGLTVTANYSNGTKTPLNADDYTLSGTLTVGTSPITVTYSEKTDNFNVNVVAYCTHGETEYLYGQEPSCDDPNHSIAGIYFGILSNGVKIYKDAAVSNEDAVAVAELTIAAYGLLLGGDKLDFDAKKVTKIILFPTGLTYFWTDGTMGIRSDRPDLEWIAAQMKRVGGGGIPATEPQ
jgi:hypothetical protein